MKKAFKYISIRLGMAACMVILAASFAYAQNLSGIVPVESSSVAPNNLSQEDSFSSVSLVEMEAIEGSSLGAPYGFLNYSAESSQYTLGKDDIIEVLVLRHSEVSGEYIINSEGKIQYEFIGDIKLKGLKKDEVKTLLIERLSEYIISPDVTIKIIGYYSKIVYVVGEVARPGKVYMRGDTITVREALVMAGLPLLTGKITHTRLITPSDTGKVERKAVNVHKLLYEGDLRENLVMKPGDTLYIPPTFMAKALRVIQPVTAPINAAAGAYPVGF